MDFDVPGAGWSVLLGQSYSMHSVGMFSLPKGSLPRPIGPDRPQ